MIFHARRGYILLFLSSVRLLTGKQPVNLLLKMLDHWISEYGLLLSRDALQNRLREHLGRIGLPREDISLGIAAGLTLSVAEGVFAELRGDNCSYRSSLVAVLKDKALEVDDLWL